MPIWCCRYCKPPKRHPGCHDHCQEYLAQRAEHEKLKAVADKQKAIYGGITAQKLVGVNRAQKTRKHMKGK